MDLMTLKFSTDGRPMVECINPNCKKLHAIYRRGDYVSRAQVRVICRSCGTKWHLSDEDVNHLRNHYELRQQELVEKKRQKDEKQQKNDEKPNQNQIDKSSKEPVKTKKEAPKKSKSFWEQIGLGD